MWACGRRRSPGFRADPPAPSRLATASQWPRPARACGGLPRSQWRVRAGFAPASLPPTDDGAIVALCHTERRGPDDGQPDPHLHASSATAARRTSATAAASRRPTRGSRPTATVDELGAQIGVALTQPGMAQRTVDGCDGSRMTCSISAPTSPCRRPIRTSGCVWWPSRSSGSSSAATRSTPSSSRCGPSCSPAERRRPPSCTSAARSAGAPSGASSHSAARPTRRRFATSTG